MAETNRIPFDLPEAEAELVAGYNVEYSAINFAVFFLAEYTNMLLNSFIYIFFFYGSFYHHHHFLIKCLLGYFNIKTLGSYNTYYLISYILNVFFLNIKVVIIACLFILIRALLPRYRFDQLMNMC